MGVTLESISEGVGPQGLPSVGEEDEKEHNDGQIGVLQDLQEQGGMFFVHG